MKNHGSKIFYLIFADTSLELLPPEYIKIYSRKRKKRKNFIIMDSFWHFKVVNKLDNSEKRGRPDIIHSALLLAQDSLLNKHGLLRVLIHTIAGKVIIIDPTWRPPRHYLRFLGLMEELFKNRCIPASDKCLLRLSDKPIKELMNELNLDIILGFSRRGTSDLTTLYKYINDLRISSIGLVIGGFSKGFFSNEISSLLDDLIMLSTYPLSTLYVTARVIVSIENQLLF